VHNNGQHGHKLQQLVSPSRWLSTISTMQGPPETNASREGPTDAEVKLDSEPEPAISANGRGSGKSSAEKRFARLKVCAHLRAQFPRLVGCCTHCLLLPVFAHSFDHRADDIARWKAPRMCPKKLSWHSTTSNPHRVLFALNVCSCLPRCRRLGCGGSQRNRLRRPNVLPPALWCWQP
jgi:hypothetical protein